MVFQGEMFMYVTIMKKIMYIIGMFQFQCLMFVLVSFTGIPIVMLHAYLNNQIGYDEDTLYISHCVRNHRNPFLWDST